MARGDAERRPGKRRDLDAGICGEIAVKAGDGAYVDVQLAGLFDESNCVLGRGRLGDHDFIDEVQAGELANLVDSAEDVFCGDFGVVRIGVMERDESAEAVAVAVILLNVLAQSAAEVIGSDNDDVAQLNAAGVLPVARITPDGAPHAEDDGCAENEQDDQHTRDELSLVGHVEATAEQKTGAEACLDGEAQLMGSAADGDGRIEAVTPRDQHEGEREPTQIEGADGCAPEDVCTVVESGDFVEDHGTQDEGYAGGKQNRQCIVHHHHGRADGGRSNQAARVVFRPGIPAGVPETVRLLRRYSEVAIFLSAKPTGPVRQNRD